MISNKYKCIFTHIPKTGGMSISFAIKDNAKDNTRTVHRTLIQDRSIAGDLFDAYFKWTVVRNPLDRFVSMYFFRKAHKHVASDPICLGIDWTFEQWLINIFNTDSPLTVCQAEWIKIDSKIQTDYIAKFENLTKDFKYVSNILGCVTKLPHLNKCKHDFYLNYYNSSLIQMVYKKCEEDMDIFKYSKKDLKLNANIFIKLI